jgi:hypothetical protein
MSISIDITARGCEQEALLVGAARLEAAAELAGLAFCEVDFGAGAMFLEDGYRDFRGVPPGHEQDSGSWSCGLPHRPPRAAHAMKKPSGPWRFRRVSDGAAFPRRTR